MARVRADKVIVHAAADAWHWALVNRSGALVDDGRCLPGAPDWPGDRSAIVLVDSAVCVGLRVDLPELSAARQHQALRWAAEEHLAGSAEEEHVVAGPRDADGRLCCIAIGNAAMRELHDQLAGRPAEAVVPDALCLPWQPGQVGLAEYGGRILARWGEWSFGSFEAELAEDMIMPVAPDQAEWVWYGGERPDWLDACNPVDGHNDRPLIGILARQAESTPVNLLSGDWSPRSALAARSQWRWAGVLAGATVVAAIAFAAVEHYQLSRQAHALEGAINERFREAFPEVSRVVRPREQGEREMARLRFGQAAGLLDLMHRAAPVIAGQEQVRLDRLDYRDGELEFTLRAPDVAALDQLEQRLRAVELFAEVRSASLDDAGASGRIRITERGR